MAAAATLDDLTRRRDELRAELAAIGDLRSGSLVKRYRKCGKKQCHCAHPDARGHGPTWSLTRKVGGKTVTQLIPPAALERTRAQIAECRRLRQLIKQLIEASNRLCAERIEREKRQAVVAAVKKKPASGSSRTRSRRRSPGS